jgi:hypothetical protein
METMQSWPLILVILVFKLGNHPGFGLPAGCLESSPQLSIGSGAKPPNLPCQEQCLAENGDDEDEETKAAERRICRRVPVWNSVAIFQVNGCGLHLPFAGHTTFVPRSSLPLLIFLYCTLLI